MDAGELILAMDRLYRTAVAQREHLPHLRDSPPKWTTMQVSLEETGKLLDQAGQNMDPNWRDAAGNLYIERIQDSSAIVQRWRQTLQDASIGPMVAALDESVQSTATLVEQQKQAFDTLVAGLADIQPGPDALAEAERIVGELANLVNEADTAVQKLDQAFTDAAGQLGGAADGSPFNVAATGVGAGGGAGLAGGAEAGTDGGADGRPETLAAAGDTGKAGGATPGTAGLSGATSGTAGPNGAASGTAGLGAAGLGNVAPGTGGLDGGTAPGLAGSPVAPTLPTPTPDLSALTPAGAGSAGLTGVAPIAGLPGAGPVVRPGGISRGSSGLSGIRGTTFQRAGTAVAASTAPVATPPEPVVPGAAAAQAAAASRAGGMVPPMMGAGIGMGTGAGGSGAPRPGDADRGAGRMRNRPGRGPAGVPDRLLGRAGTQQRSDAERSPTVDTDPEHPLDEELWQVEPAPRGVIGPA